MTPLPKIFRKSSKREQNMEIELWILTNGPHHNSGKMLHCRMTNLHGITK